MNTVKRWERLAAVGATVVVVATVGACGGSVTSSPTVTLVTSGGGLNKPTAIAVRPGGSGELWVTNDAGDSITIVSNPSGSASAVTMTDAYAEHFTAHPSGIAFSPSGQRFATSHNSSNELRGIVFVMNPERNTMFENNNFMGPTLWDPQNYALVNQNKAYRADWPQPGLGHAIPEFLPEDPCPPPSWQAVSQRCMWPAEGSHMTMLHESPLSGGIASFKANQFFVLNGCGNSNNKGGCELNGFVDFVDFNKDHGAGNGFHGDGAVTRFIDSPFTGVPGVGSGALMHDGWLYYSDTGAGVVRRLNPDTGNKQVMVSSWAGHGTAQHGQESTGITSWDDIAHPDGDVPANIDAWVAEFGNKKNIAAAGPRWIPPRETLSEYSYMFGSDVQQVTAPGDIQQPAGLAADDNNLYVADYTTGKIYAYRWSDMKLVGVLDSGKTEVSGLAFSRVGGDALYFASQQDSSIGRISLTDETFSSDGSFR